jgi:hypothetical protein
MTRAKAPLAMASTGKPDTKVNELCKDLEISRPLPARLTERARQDDARVLARK